MVLISLFFFFSSRRRHTRSLCDWSSDVCSSDLSRRRSLHIANAFEKAASFDLIHNHYDFLPLSYGGLVSTPLVTTIRSEERRVGKECRSRWSAYDLKK